MELQRNKPFLKVRKGTELALSGKCLLELMLEVLKRGVPFRFHAKGFSMSPFIKNGDLVTVFPLEDSGPVSGDVVAFIHPTTKKLAVHRIIGKKKGLFLVKGDNIPETDGLILRDDILGLVRRVEREGKRAFIGLGPERYIIALVSRWRKSFRLLELIKRLIYAVKNPFHK